MLAAMSLGIARRSIEVMNAYASERKAFGKTISHYGQVVFINQLTTILELNQCININILDPKGNS